MFGKWEFKRVGMGKGGGGAKRFSYPSGRGEGVSSENTHAHQVKRVCVNCHHYGHSQNELNNVLNSKKG